MVNACTPSVPVEENPAVMLGLIMGTAHNQGHNKLTLITSPALSGFGAWVEQLVAESTGKNGKGIIPVDREMVEGPAAYGTDRLFVYVRLDEAPAQEQDKAVEALEKAGHPVVRIAVDEIADIGEEFFRWELATAVAGSVIGIHPFDQPDVEASKVATRRLTDEYEQTGHFPAETPIFEETGIKLFADDSNASMLKSATGSDRRLADYLKAHLNRMKDGDYFALLGYIEMTERHTELLQDLRHLVRDTRRVATCLGFGPRFLHSTGQAYKGGPNSGVFLQVTCEDASDVLVPGHHYTFGVVKAAQARGDFQVLSERNRRALRVHLNRDVIAGLAKLKAAIAQALA
jgi:transaldolase/glucose-6-phosphate isomerase